MKFLFMFSSKSLSTLLSSSSFESPGLRSMEIETSLFFMVSSFKYALADNTRGPEIPKWVNSISPSTEYFSFPETLRESVAFLSDSPCKDFTHSSFVSIPTREGSVFTIV